MTCTHPPKFLRKTDNGEVCCSLCGMVVSDLELDPGFTPASPLKTNTEDMSNVEKTVFYATCDAERIAQNLFLPVERQEVRNIIRRIVVSARRNGHRFTQPQLAAFAVYEAAKLRGRPLNIKLYCQMLEEKFGVSMKPQEFYRIEVRVRKVAPDLKVTPPTVQQCIQNVATALQRHKIIGNRYALVLERYAYMIVARAKRIQRLKGETKNGDPWLEAMAAVLAADIKLGRCLNEFILTNVIGFGGAANIAKQANELKKIAPPVPEEYLEHAFYGSAGFG